MERDAREELYISLLGKSQTFHGRQRIGDIMARATNDVREINLLFNPGMNLVIGSANFMVAPFILVPSISPQLLLVPFVYVLVYVWLGGFWAASVTDSVQGLLMALCALLLPLVALVALLGGLVASPAVAAGATRYEIPADEFFDPMYNPCAGEVMDFTGTVLWIENEIRLLGLNV